MAEFTVEIDDDGLFDCIEEKIGGVVENYVDDHDFGDQISEGLDNIDLGDTVSDGIWNFRQWDEIVQKEVMRGYESWGLVVTHDLPDIIDTRIENHLRDFVITSSESRCGIGKAFADAAKHMIEEYVEGPRDIAAGSCKCDEVLSAFKSMFEIMSDTMRQLES